MSWMRSTVVVRVTREHVLCCIRCCGVRRYHPCKQRSLSCASGLRTKHYVNVNPRPFSSSALLSANTPPARTEGIAAPSGLENSEWNSDSVNQAVSEIVSEQGGNLASLGLGGYTPVGLIQTTLELIHDHSHLSWWLSIVVMTVILRLSLFPLAVKLQINAARLANLQPQLEEIHLRMTKFRESGNQELLNQEAARMMALYRKHGCNPLKMFIMPFVQFPIFVSFFIALRQMAQLPMTSMKAGGTLWFPDLTLPDPTFVLPLIACASFLANIEVTRTPWPASASRTRSDGTEQPFVSSGPPLRSLVLCTVSNALWGLLHKDPAASTIHIQ